MNIITRKFISAGASMSDFGSLVPAPLLRRSFNLDSVPESAALTITGVGFYRLFINGREVTRGHMSPYISNPDHFLYFDRYDIGQYLRKGENVLGVMLGAGIRNCIGGLGWGFTEARYRGAPVTAMKLEAGEYSFEADERFRCHSSPILFDDMRIGEIYDARLEDETEGWTLPGFDDSGWHAALPTEMLRGEQRIADVPPITVRGKLSPVKIWREDDSFIYDFGQNGAGLVTLRTDAEAGRHIVVDFAEILVNGRFYNDTIAFSDDERLPYHRQTLDYTASGRTGQEYTPSFTYYGFRYARVRGIKESEATDSLLEYSLMSSRMAERGDFVCSDSTLTSLQRMTRESDLSNLFHIPTDCPHREKNGWTADAALSAVHMLTNLDVDELLTEWSRNVSASLRYDGAMPGIVPAADWGYDEWNGPAWDSALVEVPYQLWRLRGDMRAARYAAPAMMRYVAYTMTRRDERGLVHFGLGDWSAPHTPFKAPLELTDSVTCCDISEKAAALYRAMNMREAAEWCDAVAASYREAVREHLICHESATAAGRCQTSQAMALYYGMFTEDEREAATNVLLELINEADGHLDCGVLGARVIFRVLAESGYVDTAYRMIVRPDAPSYGNWVVRGDTTLAEEFGAEGDRINSRNHHFFGDISAWMIDTVCGIRVNPRLEGADTVDVVPHLPEELSWAEAYHILPVGRVEVKLCRKGDMIILSVTAPDSAQGRIIAPDGYAFGDGSHEKLLSCRSWELVKC